MYNFIYIIIMNKGTNTKKIVLKNYFKIGVAISLYLINIPETQLVQTVVTPKFFINKQEEKK